MLHWRRREPINLWVLVEQKPWYFSLWWVYSCLSTFLSVVFLSVHNTLSDIFNTVSLLRFKKKAWDWLAKEIQYHPRYCSRTSLSPPWLTPQGHSPRPEGEQHPSRWENEPKNIRFWIGSDVSGNRVSGKHSQSCRNPVRIDSQHMVSKIHSHYNILN